MRTLKKTLSLVLVVAMVLGLCVVGASAYNKVEDFTDDVSKIGTAYYEAVGVLTGIGVIDGMTETAFEPQGNYTREQAAKIIAYMQLGKDKADSLKCTVAPFEDVAATRWSAGYIAYCVEQGIIDGMTETTFEPTGKLTGFQWAKMLLCAVGFGVNGEFTGSSWSVNTAKVAHTVDLFAGDLAGADHVALTREQAALYAFNVLTNVKKVAYSANVTSYVYGIRGYTTVNGIGSTLGQDVFGLTSNTGIIVKNEGIGANATYLSKDYTDATTSRVAVIDAKTSADMIYHAARVWSVKNVSVFVYDLAKVTEYNCAVKAGEAAAAKAGAKTTTIGTGTPYELDLIDNTAYAKNSYGAVTYNYRVAEMGITTSSGVTYLYDPSYYQSNAGIKSANIWTDISKISKGASVVYLVEGGQYYIYANSATTGTIDSYNNSTKVITLTDGTKLAPSAFSQYGFTTADAGKTFTFLLDSHGHYMGLTKVGVANLYFYTGEAKLTSDHNIWYGERTYSAQFINVTTGEVVELPVYSTFVVNNLGTAKGAFYDVGYADKNGVYSPVEKTENDSIYAGTYAIKPSVTFAAGTIKVNVKDGQGTKDVVFDNPTKFIVANGTGSKVTVTTYNSLAEMLKAFTGSNVTFVNTAMTVYTTGTKNAACSVVFGYLGSYTSTGSNLFLPKDLKASDWTYSYSTGLYSYDGFYLNGAPVTVYVSSALDATKVRGFYNFSISNGAWTLTEKTTDVYVGLGTLTTAANVVMLDNHAFVSAPVIVDLRSGVKDADKIDTVDELVANFRNETFMVAYTLSNKSIDVAYILDAGWQYKTTVSVSDDLYAAGWRLVDAKGSLVKSLTYTDTTTAPTSYKLANVNVKVPAVPYTNYVTVTENGSLKSAPTAQGNADGTITVTYDPTDPTQTAREVSVVFGGMKANSMSFNATGLTDIAVEANTTNYVFGTPLNVKVSFTTDDYSVGKALSLTFQSAEGTEYNVTATTPVIPVGSNSYSVTVTVYPTVDDTFTLQTPVAVITPIV